MVKVEQSVARCRSRNIVENRTIVKWGARAANHFGIVELLFDRALAGRQAAEDLPQLIVRCTPERWRRQRGRETTRWLRLR